MAITITWFSVGTNIGPGMWADVTTNLVGPLEDLAYATLDLVDPSAGGIVCRGSKYMHGSHTATVTLGRFDGGHNLAPPSEGAQVGLSVRLSAAVYNAAGVRIDGFTQLATALAFVDSGQWFLLGQQSADLSPVLAAVRRTYGNAP